MTINEENKCIIFHKKKSSSMRHWVYYRYQKLKCLFNKEFQVMLQDMEQN